LLPLVSSAWKGNETQENKCVCDNIQRLDEGERGWLPITQ